MWFMPDKKKLLILDDEALFRKTFEEDLRYCGYSCKTAESPSEGIRQLKIDHFDLILLDIMMEPLDGWDTLDLIRNLTHGFDTPVIMVSGKKLDLLEVVRYGERLYGFMKKPLTREEICAGIYSFFRWNEALVQAAVEFQKAAIPEEDIHVWMDLSRQVRVITDLKEEAALRCIPDEERSEEECMELLIQEIDDMIREKRTHLVQLTEKYPIMGKTYQ